MVPDFVYKNDMTPEIRESGKKIKRPKKEKDQT